MKQKLLLALILVLAFALRIYNLSNNPPGFFCDEASIGYNAYTILKTGRDEYGIRLPLFFKSVGDYKSPLLIYSIVPSIAFFGLNEFAVRLPSVIYGTLTVLTIFLLAKNFFNENAGLLAAFLLAISPWHVHLSRSSMEGLLLFVFLVTLGLYFFLRGLNKNNLLLSSFFLFGLALYTYSPTRLFVPLFVLGLLFIYQRKLLLQRKVTVLALLLFILLALPLGWHLYQGEGFARWQQVSIFNQGLSLPKTILRVFNLYLAHFTPDFLFRLGDIDYPGQFILRHSVRGLGELYWFQLPFLIVGLIALARKKTKSAIILGWWLLLYPLADSLTNVASPQATRTIIGVIPFQIITAYGVILSFELLQKTKKLSLRKASLLGLSTVLIIVVSCSFFDFTVKLYKEYHLYAADYWGWQYGPKEIVKYFTQIEGQYDELIMSGEFNAPYIFFKFYAPDGCKKCRIGNLKNIDSSKRQLFALRPHELSNGLDYILRKKILYPNGDLAFLIIEPTQK